MVKFIFIRHGLTKSNSRDFRAGNVAHQSGLTDMEETKLNNQWAMQEPGVSAWDEKSCDIERSGDSELTEVGIGEAQALADYWAPILANKAAKNQLTVISSPMRRCLQTIDPLMKRLNLSATIERELYCQ